MIGNIELEDETNALNAFKGRFTNSLFDIVIIDISRAVMVI